MVQSLSQPAGARSNDPPSQPLSGGWEVVADRATAHPGLLRQVARAHLELCGLGESSMLDTVPLLLTELVTNAIQHGGGHVGVRVGLRDRQILVEVADGGLALPVLRHLDVEAENGRGLLLVEALAESWGTRAGGAITWCAVMVPTDHDESARSSMAAPSHPV